jgi:hypothetical protein
MQHEPVELDSHGQPWAPVPPAPVAAWKKVLAVPMVALTVVYALGGGLLLGIAILSWAAAAPFFEWESRAPADASFRMAGWGPAVGVGLILIALASLQNRIRRRMLRPKRKPARPSAP